MTQSVSLSFYRFAGPAARFWALRQMAFARLPLARTPDIGFWKLCGSGKGEGFTPILFPEVFAIVATWPDEATARVRVETAPVFARYRRKAAESWTVFLSATSSRGDWSGVAPFKVGPQRPGPLAALTRATVKPKIAARFWRRVPDISAKIGADANVAFKIGIGEVPLLHQVTFSIWPDERRDGRLCPHGPPCRGDPRRAHRGLVQATSSTPGSTSHPIWAVGAACRRSPL
jgi:spheroidene monooxygenase